MVVELARLPATARLPARKTWTGGPVKLLCRENLALSTALSSVMSPSNVSYNPVGSSRVDLQACKLEYSIVSPK